MNFFSLLSVALIAASALAQIPKSGAPPTLERLCGKLTQSENFPVKGEARTFTTKYRDLRHVAVNLYPAEENKQCCEGIAAIASTVTGHWGAFEFKPKHVPAGLYALEVQTNGRKNHLLVRYAPKRFSDQLCYQTYWDVNNEWGFREGTLVTID